MSHCSGRRNSEPFVGDRARGSCAACDIGCSCTEYGTARSLRPAGAELAYSPAVCRADYAVCLCGDKRLMIEGEKQERFNKLRLNRRSTYRYDRLSREDGRTLRHCVDISGKTEGAQIVEEFLVKAFFGAQIFDVLLGKTEVVYIVDDLFKTAGDSVSAVIRILTVKYVEIRYLVL